MDTTVKEWSSALEGRPGEGFRHSCRNVDKSEQGLLHSSIVPNPSGPLGTTNDD
jgi:hypothetical protein